MEEQLTCVVNVVVSSEFLMNSLSFMSIINLLSMGEMNKFKEKHSGILVIHDLFQIGSLKL